MEEKSSCDGVHEFKLLLSCPSGLSPSQVSVVSKEAYYRIPHPDPFLEQFIFEEWEARERLSSIYNRPKFRYGGYTFDIGNDPKQQLHVSLQLGLTDYRLMLLSRTCISMLKWDFVGTNLISSIWERYLVPSEDDCIQCQHTSSPLGNGAIVETSDKKILVLQRSN